MADERKAEIRIGQIYESTRLYDEPARIRVAAYTPGADHADTVNAATGGHPRRINVSWLNPRWYRLVQNVETTDA